MAEHTPGPWSSYHNEIFGDPGAGRRIIAKVRGNPQHPEVSANVRLITAAPKLLEALETLFTATSAMLIGSQVLGINMDDDDFPPEMKAAWDKARAAIEAAKGE